MLRLAFHLQAGGQGFVDEQAAVFTESSDDRDRGADQSEMRGVEQQQVVFTAHHVPGSAVVQVCGGAKRLSTAAGGMRFRNSSA